MRATIINLLKKVVNPSLNKLSEGRVSLPEIDVFIPDNEKFGHYSANAAFGLAKLRKISPLAAAQEIKEGMEKAAPANLFERIEVAPPGFVNFWLSAKTLRNELKNILKKKEKYGAGSRKKEKILVEFLSANPTGPIHVGNGRGAFLGDALIRILGVAGYRVSGEYYVNDAKISNQIRELGKTALGKGTSYLSEELKFQIARVKNKLKGLNEAGAGYLLAKEIQKDNRRFIERKLKIKYDNFFSEESFFKNDGVGKILGGLKKKNLAYEKDGAWWFRSADYGDSEDRVLIRQGGEPTYFMSDLVYHLDKFRKRKFSKVINIWGADHHGYAPRLKAGLKALEIDENRLEIIITQFVRLVSEGKEVKMSKRLGQIEKLEDLIDEVGLDAARFFFLTRSPDSHIDFDLKLAKERSVKNPVYYVQYAFVRCGAILNKIKTSHFARSRVAGQNLSLRDISQRKTNYKLLNTNEELDLIRQLIRFPEILEDIAANYKVHQLTIYTLELARAFHNFYEKERVIGDDEELTRARLALVRGTQIVLKSILDILGISTPKKM